MKGLPTTAAESQAAEFEPIYTSYQGASTQENEFRGYLNILKRRKWCIIIPLIVIIPVTLLILLQEEPTYEATSRLLMEDDTSKVKIIDIKEVLIPEKSTDFYRTQYALIKSRDIVEEVAEVLGLYDKQVPEEGSHIVRVINAVQGFPGWLIGIMTRQIKSRVAPPEENAVVASTLSPAELHRQAVITRFRKSLQVQPVPGTKLVDITIRGDDPSAVAPQVNTLAEVYISRNLEKKLEASREAVAWLTKETTDLKEKMYTTQLALQRFREEKNLISFDIDENQNAVLRRLTDLHTAYTQANAERVALETQLNRLRELSASNIVFMDSLPAILNNSSVAVLKQKYLELQVQRANLSKYKPEYPEVIRINSQIDDVKRAVDLEIHNVINSIHTDHKLFMAKETAIAKELHKQQTKSLRLSNDMIAYTALKRDAESDRTLYLEASKRLREITLTQGLIANNIRVVERADVPIAPIPAGRMKKMLLSVIMGGCLGVGFALIREYLDKRFTKVEEVERYLHVPFLGIIPHHKLEKQGTYRPVMLHAPGSLASETYRMLRTRIQASPLEIKTLLITSTIAGEGKSTTAANLGVAFAQLGLRVLLVDADLRRPSLHRPFTLTADVGLTDVLGNGVDWGKVALTTGVENLKVLPVGFRPHNPSDLLSQRHMKTLVASLKSAFDLVLFDAPPVLSLPDAETLAPAMDGVLLVHSPTRGEKEMTLVAKGLLERVGGKLIGVIFNNVTEKEHKYYAYPSSYIYSSENPIGRRKRDFIEMTTLMETKQWIAKIGQNESKDFIPLHTSHSIRNNGLLISISEYILKEEINEKKANDGWIYLILKLEISNETGINRTFCPDLTSVYTEPNQAYNLASNIIDSEEIIEPHSHKSYFIVYQVPKQTNDYFFVYKDNHIKIL